MGFFRDMFFEGVVWPVLGFLVLAGIAFIFRRRLRLGSWLIRVWRRVIGHTRPTEIVELRVYTSVAIDEPGGQILGPFERDNRVVITQTPINDVTLRHNFQGGLQTVRDFLSPYDLLIIDQEVLSALRAIHIPLIPLNVYADNLLPPLNNNENVVRDAEGNLFSIPLYYGINALAYNTLQVYPGEINSYDDIFKERFVGRVGLWDHWPVIMGLMSLHCFHKGGYGNSKPFDPFDLTDDQLQVVKEELVRLANQDPSLYPIDDPQGPRQLRQHLAAGEIFVAMGGAESFVPMDHGDEASPALVDWLIPKEGALYWCNCAVVTDVGNPQRHLVANKLVQYFYSRHVQEILIKSGTFRNQSVHREVPNNFDELEARIYKITRAETLTRMMGKAIFPRKNPRNSEKWIEIWLEVFRDTPRILAPMVPLVAVP